MAPKRVPRRPPRGRTLDTPDARFKRIEALVEQQVQDLQIQFQRIAQLQAEVDELRVKVENVKEWLAERRKIAP